MPGYDDQDLAALGRRIEEVLDQFHDFDGGPAVDRRSATDLAEDLVRTVTQFYGAGLERIMHILGSTSTAGSAGAALDRVVADPFLTGLLVLHDLHPKDTATRIQEALDAVRPYMGSHGGDIEVVKIDPHEGVVHLRMLGACDGCPSSAATLEHAVEEAVLAAAPEIGRIAVEGAVAPQVPSTPVALGRKPA